ncbi:thermonuclease family protein [Iamia sp.]|uniref:thermonuclease family protein n=1 Tax=Iamia sp. TaxID=2722710 RepID=UPI002C2AA8FE|nr:thermonuclease family protein [Iamia sp.]HXH58448.1 thermonuclease family protein [Iamia sp.]
MSHPYDYKIVDVLRVVDGDTVDVVFDVGFRVTTTQRVRLLGVDTPELRDPVPDVRVQAVAAKEFVIAWFRAVELLELRASTHKSDSFGRWLADIYAVDRGESSHLVDDLLAGGYATRWGR